MPAPTVLPKEAEKVRKQRTGWGFILLVVLSVAILLTLGILGAIGFGMIQSTKSNLSVVTYTLIMNPEWIFESTIVEADWANYVGFGQLQVDINSNQLSYTIQIDIPMDDSITFLSIHGPTTASNPKTASVFLHTSGS